ncbi:MAG TPA: heavy-metal-associated domain-containing protein [Marmoricola sp.]|nr:heavy-metal-associated domain-containing protein [Marmoricola sp.]
MSVSTTYTVTGMTCQHCVNAVTSEIGEVPGVTGVEVDLDTGRVEVSGEGFTDEQVAAAVDEAGYQLA